VTSHLLPVAPITSCSFYWQLVCPPPNASRACTALTCPSARVRCPDQFYSLQQGSSSGQPGQSSLFNCSACPLGGQCTSSGVSAVPGYWGAQTPSLQVAATEHPDVSTPPSPTPGSLVSDLNDIPSLSFSLCPRGYCCTGDAGSPTPCSAIDVCAGNRQGQLCGDCAPGFTESFGSAVCVPVPSCDRRRFVAVMTVGVVLSAAMQLLVVSDVWRPSSAYPKVNIKLGIYFFQVCFFPNHFRNDVVVVDTCAESYQTHHFPMHARAYPAHIPRIQRPSFRAC
jgi:hypothetical protein